MHLWYSQSYQACDWLSESGYCWAPGGSVMYTTSQDNGTTWSNLQVSNPLHMAHAVRHYVLIPFLVFTTTC
jgi:hypothetical protein